MSLSWSCSHSQIFFFLLQFLDKVYWKLLCPVSMSWKQQATIVLAEWSDGRFLQWRRCSSQLCWLCLATRNRQVPMQSQFLYGWIYEATSVETPRKCQPKTTTQECSQILLSRGSLKETFHERDRFPAGIICTMLLVWKTPTSRTQILLKSANSGEYLLL